MGFTFRNSDEVVEYALGYDTLENHLTNIVSRITETEGDGEWNEWGVNHPDFLEELEQEMKSMSVYDDDGNEVKGDVPYSK